MRCALVFAVFAACADPSDAPPDAVPERGWATYTIAAGAHDAHLTGREPKNPIDGVVSVVGRDFELALNPSAIYTIVDPAVDQFDWNKLPGLSDCGTIDLSVDGAMFGWRWNLDAQVLEVTAYANNAGTHLSLPAPLFTLDAAQLAAESPLRYRVVREQTQYRFSVTGPGIAADATLPRRCTSEVRDPLAWAGAFYFGGTSTAPHEVTAKIREMPFSESP